MRLSTLFAGLLALGAQQAVAAAIQSETPVMRADTEMVEKRAMQCGGSLTTSHCSQLSGLGWTTAGINAKQSSGNNSIYLGSSGSYKATFKNTASQAIILVVWNQNHGYGSSFVQTNQPQLAVSISPRKSVSVSFDEGATGAFSAIYPDTKMDNGQISNTWGEFSTGQWATVDVSREVNMSGHSVSIHTPAGCTSNMQQCVFTCKSGNKCWEANTYTLDNCSGANTANGGTAAEPSGGCQGWTTGGTVQVTLGK